MQPDDEIDPRAAVRKLAGKCPVCRDHFLDVLLHIKRDHSYHRMSTSQKMETLKLIGLAVQALFEA